MNLYKIYHDICNRGHERGTKKAKGFELHHIIPKSYFKSRKIATYNENLCLLTPKEHYVVHHLLARTGCPKMLFAFYRMIHSKGQNSHKITSKEYELMKLEHSKNVSKCLKGRTKSEEHKRKLSLSLIGHNASEETRKKLSLARKGKQRLNMRGHVPWNKGLKNGYSKESLLKMSISQKNRFKNQNNSLISK